jgi:LysR family transcriptional regulator, glycine cleavage system transcriptional activator
VNDCAHARLPLNALRVFEAVASRLSFAAAAEVLHVTAAAVSQQIKTLEDYLDTPLFRRAGRRVELTPEGELLLPRVRRGLDELEAALTGLQLNRRSGTLNVSMLASFLQKWLTHRLNRLQVKHPDIGLRIHTSREAVDFARSDFHAAIRLGSGGYPGMRCERLLEEWLIPIASPDVLAKYGPLCRDSDLTNYPVLQAKDEGWARWLDGGKHPAEAGPSIDDSVSVQMAAERGQGYALARWSLVADDIALGRLVLAGDVAVSRGLDYWLVSPESYANLPKLRQFWGWLKEEARVFPQPPVKMVGGDAGRRGSVRRARAARPEK